MKKINLVLCAAAVACAAFFVSCKNEAETPEITFVNQTTTQNKYSVTGTYTEVVADATVNAAGTASTTDPTVTTKTTVSSGYANVRWTEDKTYTGNESYSRYSINFYGVNGTENTQRKSGTTVTQEFATELTVQPLVIDGIALYKIGENFYYETEDGQYIKATVGEGFESGEDFKLSLTWSEVVDNLGWVTTDATVSKASDKTKTTYTYDLSFKAAK